MNTKSAIATAVVVSLMADFSGCASPPPARSDPQVVQVSVNYGAQHQSASYKTIERGALAGVPQRVGFFYSINPDCTFNGLVRMQIKSPPAHGAVAFDNAEGYTNFSAKSPGYDCNRQKSRGVEVLYTAQKIFSGTDAFTVQAVGPNGRYMETEYSVKF